MQDRTAVEGCGSALLAPCCLKARPCWSRACSGADPFGSKGAELLLGDACWGSGCNGVSAGSVIGRSSNS